MKKNYYTIPIILYVLLSSFLMLECPSGRQKSRKERVSAAPTITPAEKAQPVASSEKLQPIVQGPTTPKPAIAQKVGTAALKPVTNPEPQTTANTKKNQAVYELFEKKLKYSSDLTQDVIGYVFQNVLDELKKSSNVPDQKKLQKIKGYFYGLRYPVYRHLREVISACTDPNAFLCGGFINYIITSSYDAREKESLLNDLKQLASTLKKFKFYQIDNQLEGELTQHIGQIKAMIDKRSINQGERKIIKKYYIKPLSLLKMYISLADIKAILPNRESSLYYGYRKAAKKIVTTGTSVGYWLKNIALNHLVTKGFNLFNSYVPKNFNIQQTSIEQKKQAVLFEGLNKVGEGIRTVLKDPKTLVTKPLQVIAVPIRGVNALWKKPKLILEGLQYTRNNFRSSAKSAALWTLFNGYELTMNRYFGAQAINRWITKILTLADRSVAPSVTAFTITPTDLQTHNLNFMTTSAGFIDAYAQQLCNVIAQSSIDLPQSTAALQSAQIEIFRHRRTIISELSNKHAFTYNYFLSMHEDFVDDFADQINTSIEISIKKNKTISENELAEKAEQVLTARINKKNEFFNFMAELTPDDYAILNKLATRASTDSRNTDDLMYLAQPIDLEDAITRFDTHIKKIVDELKSFGARSKNQLIQNYWLSVIDQSYSKKLQDHLNAVIADLDALMADANHTINCRDMNGNTYYYTNKNVDGSPIAIGIPKPKIPQSSAEQLDLIVRTFYINPLAKIAARLEREDIAKKLPADKKWYIKYPLYATKMNIKFHKKVFEAAIENITIDNIIDIGTAYLTGGISLLGPAILRNVSFSAIALKMLDIDFINPPLGDSYLSSAASSAIGNLIFSSGPTAIKKYIKGETGIISNMVKKSGTVKKLGSALRAHERISRSY